MTAAQTPDDDALDILARLLDTRAVPFGGMNLEALDGFFSALAVGPELVPPGEWIAEVWGPKPPNWESVAEAQEVMDLLMGHWNLVAERVRHAGDEMSERLLPVVWLPEDENDPDAAFTGHDWALGFLRGVDLRKPAWEAWFEGEDWISGLYLDMVSLVLGRDMRAAGQAAEGEDAFESESESEPTGSETAGDALAAPGRDDDSPEIREDDPDDPDDGADMPEDLPPLTVAERIEIVLDLPWLLYDLNVHRVEALTPRTPIRAAAVPGRNDPCSCGSGRKYKKCCGAA